MTSELAHLATLITYGNAKVRGLDLDAASVDAAFNDRWSDVRFIFGRVLARERIVAATAKDWIRWLDRRACSGLRLAVAFAGGGPTWTMSTRFAKDIIWWRHSMHLTSPPPKTHWRFDYHGEVVDVEELVEPLALEPLMDRLHAALTRARQFALHHEELTLFSDWFTAALEALRAEFPESVTVHGDTRPIVAVAALGLPARRLFAAARRAWVFGGMGSWNDNSFREQAVNDEYRDITAELYDAVLESIMAAVNSSDQPTI